MIRFCSIFAAMLLLATTVWAQPVWSQPVDTRTIEGSFSVLPSMTWLPDPQNTKDYAAATSPEAQSGYLPLTRGFPVQATGPGWLRLELAKNEQQSSSTPSRVDKKSLYLNLSFLPSGKATLYRTGSFSPQAGSGSHQPLASRVYPFQTERLADPSISNAVYYLHLEETPGLWFNPTLSRTDNKSPILPHDLLLPSILLACLAFSLLRLAIDRTIWPIWAAGILVCVITGLLLPTPIAAKTLTYKDLPVLIAPGIAVMIYAHLGRLLLYSPAAFPKGDTVLRLYPIVGAAAALAPLLPNCYWLTRLFPLWGLLLIPLLAVAASALVRQLKGSFAYFVATFMPVLGAVIALYGVYNPDINMLSKTGTFWGVAIGSFALIFARSALPTPKEAKEAESKKKADTGEPLDVFDSLAQKTAVGAAAVAQGPLEPEHKGSALDIPPLTMSDEPDDIFSSLQYANLSGIEGKKKQGGGISPHMGDAVTASHSTERQDFAQKADPTLSSPSPSLDEPLTLEPRGKVAEHKPSANDDEDILELRTLAEPPHMKQTATPPKTAQPLDWPPTDEFLSPSAKPIDIFAADTGQSVEEPLLALSSTGTPLTVPPQGLKLSLTDSSTHNTAHADSAHDSARSNAHDSARSNAHDSALTERTEETVPQHEPLPEEVQEKSEKTTEAQNLAMANVQDDPAIQETPPAPQTVEPGFHDISPAKTGGAGTGETDVSAGGLNTVEQALQQGFANPDSPAAEEKDPGLPVYNTPPFELAHETPAVIQLHDESLEAAIPPSAEKKVDAVLASLETIQPSSDDVEYIELSDNSSAEPAEGEALAPSIPAPPTAITSNSEKTEQEESDRAYIEALLTPRDKHTPHTTDEAVLSPAESHYLQHHSEEERQLVETHGPHCIIITDMTTSNKRLLRSYFNEIGIPCVEAHGIDDTLTLQMKTGSPLVIYDADSPADTIVESIKRLGSASQQPNHLVLASVESQGQHLVEQGATLAINKPFTKESLFEATYKTAPALFGESQLAAIRPLLPQNLFSQVSAPEASLETTTTGMSPAAVSGATVSPAPTNGLAGEDINHAPSETDNYAQKLLDGSHSFRDSRSTPPETVARASDDMNEKRVDDLLAQLNGEDNVQQTSPGTSAEQTASVIAKVLSTEPGRAPKAVPTTSPETPKNKDSLLDFIVAEDAITAASEKADTGDTATESSPPQTGMAEMPTEAKTTPTGETPLDVPKSGSINQHDDIPQTMNADSAKTSLPMEGVQLLSGFEDEYIEQLMLPLIPGLLYTLKDGLRDAELGLAEQQLFAVQESVSNIASKAETFGLKKLAKIAQCVVRATSADDLEATTALMDDLGNITKRYISGLETCYDEYIASSRPK